jgi:hypothetical protein
VCCCIAKVGQEVSVSIVVVVVEIRRGNEGDIDRY